MFKHLVSYFFQDALSDNNHHPVVDKTCNNAQDKNTCQYSHCLIQLAEIRILLSYQREDKIVQQESQ